MELPVNGSTLYTVSNVTLYTKQGTSFIAGGNFTTTSGVPSQELLPSTNTVLGYYNGQMLARAAGDGSGSFAGLTAGALINFDPASSDTGQAKWNGFVICDAGLKAPLAVGTTFPGSLQIATPLQGWILRQQYLYAGGTPSSDATVVNTAVTTTVGVTCVQTQTMNSSGSTETIFSY